jgi:hypothetical protein
VTRPYRRYTLWFLAVFAAGAITLVALNGLRARRSWMQAGFIAQAAEWQSATGGIVDIPFPLQRSFKALQLRAILPGVETMVFGSSTTQTITAGMLPGHAFYNFSISGNTTSQEIAEVAYVVDRAPKLRLVAMSLDWALDGPSASPDLRYYDVPSEYNLRVPVAKLVADALTLPRVRELAVIAVGLTRDARPLADLRATFLDADGRVGDAHPCAEGPPGRSFGVAPRPGLCPGIRTDGSFTYVQYPPVGDKAPEVIRREVQLDSNTMGILRARRGRLNPTYLQAIGRLAATLRARDGRLVLILPPLLPGLESSYLATAEAGPYLQALKSRLAAWTRSQGIDLIDVGASERFGCTVDEFIDDHHALSACFSAIFRNPGLERL